MGRPLRCPFLAVKRETSRLLYRPGLAGFLPCARQYSQAGPLWTWEEPAECISIRSSSAVTKPRVIEYTATIKPQRSP